MLGFVLKFDIFYIKSKRIAKTKEHYKRGTKVEQASEQLEFKILEDDDHSFKHRKTLNDDLLSEYSQDAVY